MVDGKPTCDEAPGANLFIARTKRGEELISGAAASGAIHLDPYTVDDLGVLHADHIPRKIENPARGHGIELERASKPDFKYFRADEMVALAGAERHENAIQRTRKRTQNNAHKEPLV